MSVDRVACPRCSSNNFATQARCWSCGTPLGGGATPSAPPNASAPAPALPPVTNVSPAVASWATVAMGIFFPFFAVPIGIVFLMLDDKRKCHIGWQAILWGTVGTVVQLIAGALLGSMLTGPLLQSAIRLTGQAQSQRSLPNEP
jgi:hypothetical protein